MCPPRTTSRSAQQQRTHPKHRHYALERAGVVNEWMVDNDQAIPETQRWKWYLDRYIKAFGFDKDDIRFLDDIARLHVNGEISSIEDGTRYYHTILEGHSWLVDKYDPNIPQLLNAGLIRFPQVNGEQRYRLNRRTYFEITPAGKDVMDYDWAGEGIGDEGEGIVHRLGMWITYFWLTEKYSNIDNNHPHASELMVSQYPSIRESQLDLAVRYYRMRCLNGEEWGPKIAAEIEADSQHLESSMNDVRKMGNICRDTIWVFPNREILSKVVNEAISRGYFDNLDSIPETLPLRNHRDTWSGRLESAEPNRDRGLDYNPVKRVYTYNGLLDDLKDVRPDLFHATPGQYDSSSRLSTQP